MSETQQPPSLLDEHLQLVDALSEEFHTQTLMVSADVDRLKEFVTFFYVDLPAYRFSMLNEDFIIDRLWDAMRGRQAAFDSVLDLTSLLAGIASTQKGGWQAVEAFVINAMSIHGNNRMTRFMDKEELSEFCSDTQAKAVIKLNPWLCTLYMLRVTPTYRAGLDAFINPKKPGDA